MSPAGKSSAAIFLAASMCFFLSFSTVSCNGRKMMSFRGMQLAFGTTVQTPAMFGPAQRQEVKPEALAILALISAIFGFCLSFVKNEAGMILDGLAGLMGLIFLWLLKSKMEGELARQSSGVVQIQYDIGFYGACLLFILAAAVNTYFLFGKAAAPLVSAAAASGGGGSGAKYCGECGAKIAPGNQFCNECGSRSA